ncbi:MAG: hypothetical protein FDZ70_07450 [Actinobacteria bacterium]|nr:MAG: hypothetical protein FDZ70_07450 [Actinomycetota bacterium]
MAPAAPTSTVRPQPLWIRVDRNRAKLAAFVALFIGGSAALLSAALVAVPGYLLGWGAGEIEFADRADWYARMPLVIGGAFLLLLLVGSIIAAVQLSNAEDWVKSRFKGRELAEGEAERFRSSVHDMTLAGGLGVQPRIILLPTGAVNAFAIGTTRKRPVIGVTQGLLDTMSDDEERAVVATLVARIVAGDIMFGTALAALMGPIKAIRGSAGAGAGCASEGCQGCGNTGCSGADLDGCGDAAGCLGDLDSDSAGGCGAALVVIVFLAIVAALTYAAVVTASWIVTLWGRALHRTGYEKADAEGMLLLKDPLPMLSALRCAITSENRVLDVPDPSYDSIFYVATSGKPSVDRAERRRFVRLAEVLGVEGGMELLERPLEDGTPAQ